MVLPARRDDLSQVAVFWPEASNRAKALNYPRGWVLMHAMERVAAAALLFLFSPFLVAIAFVIMAFSGKSPLVAHRRVGQNGAALWVLKLRTMWPSSRAKGRCSTWIEYLVETDVPETKAGSDPRVTSRFAAFLRKYSIDELPQLLHVLLGDMALVGPRPLTRTELSKYYGTHVAEVTQMRPGLTGLWQIKGRNRLSYRQRLRLDSFLVRNFCLLLYLKILFRTPALVLSGRDAW